MDNVNEGDSQPESRFDHHLKSNLIHLRKNLYLNRTDPLFFEKILHYADPKSSEAHYMLAQKYEKTGNHSKAVFHYQEAASNQDSPFYAKAKDRIRRIQRPRLPASIAASRASLAPTASVMKQRTFRKTPFIVLLLCNLILLLLVLFNMGSIRAVVSTVVHGKVGLEVVNETVDAPYVIYISINEAKDSIESRLYRKAYELGKASPTANIQLYGIKTEDFSLQGTIAPLTSEPMRSAAFVIAQYNASIDQAVRIQFQIVPPLTLAASNLVRTALAAYLKENGRPPAHIESLAGDYPNNYLSFIPNEAQSGSNQVVQQFDGKGGWVYHPLAANVSSQFYPNITDEPHAVQSPYFPVNLLISIKDHLLLLVSNDIVLASKSIGTGKDNRTPVGEFTIEERVMNPLGKHLNVYGLAGLSMGQYAIHGTYDATSVAINKSLGCIRASNEDMLALFPLVPKGATVQIMNRLPSSFRSLSLTDPTPLIPAEKPQNLETPLHHIFNWLG